MGIVGKSVLEQLSRDGQPNKTRFKGKQQLSDQDEKTCGIPDPKSARKKRKKSKKILLTEQKVINLESRNQDNHRQNGLVKGKQERLRSSKVVTTATIQPNYKQKVKRLNIESKESQNLMDKRATMPMEDEDFMHFDTDSITDLQIKDPINISIQVDPQEKEDEAGRHSVLIKELQPIQSKVRPRKSKKKKENEIEG